SRTPAPPSKSPAGQNSALRKRSARIQTNPSSPASPPASDPPPPGIAKPAIHPQYPPQTPPAERAPLSAPPAANESPAPIPPPPIHFLRPKTLSCSPPSLRHPKYAPAISSAGPTAVSEIHQSAATPRHILPKARVINQQVDRDALFFCKL